ncbi:MAG TPA: hypothetical protein VFH73_28420 [Polyangia bacterium]|nr:hypothetical protein [Polyangia bacterium]
MQRIRVAVRVHPPRFRGRCRHRKRQAAVARDDVSPNTRAVALILLGDRLPALPTARPVLENARAHDADARNRQLAARYLTAARPRVR